MGSILGPSRKRKLPQAFLDLAQQAMLLGGGLVWLTILVVFVVPGSLHFI